MLPCSALHCCGLGHGRKRASECGLKLCWMLQQCGAWLFLSLLPMPGPCPAPSQILDGDKYLWQALGSGLWPIMVLVSEIVQVGVAGWLAGELGLELGVPQGCSCSSAGTRGCALPSWQA